MNYNSNLFFSFKSLFISSKLFISAISSGSNSTLNSDSSSTIKFKWRITVATLWKIATGLHISFTALLEGRQTETQLIRRGEVSPLLSDEGRFRLFPFFPYDAERRFEMLSIELEPGTRSESVPHEDGTEEFVLVFEGALRLTVDGVEYVVEAGEGIRYLANKPHIYECHGTQKTKICMVIYYDK